MKSILISGVDVLVDVEQTYKKISAAIPEIEEEHVQSWYWSGFFYCIERFLPYVVFRENADHILQTLSFIKTEPSLLVWIPSSYTRGGGRDIYETLRDEWLYGDMLVTEPSLKLACTNWAPDLFITRSDWLALEAIEKGQVPTAIMKDSFIQEPYCSACQAYPDLAYPVNNFEEIEEIING